MTRFKIKSFYSFTALAAIVPLIAMLLITLFYIDRQETKHQENLMGNAQADIVSSLEDTLEDLQQDTASLTTSMDYLVFCNSSTSRRVHNAGNSVLNTLKNALQAYPEVIGIFLYNTQSEETISHFAYTTLALYQERISEILKAETPENLRSYWRTESLHAQPFVFLKLHRRYGNVLIVLDPQKSERFTAYNLTFRNNASYIFYDAVPIQSESIILTTQVEPLGLYLICQTEGKSTLAAIQLFFLLIILFFFLVAMGQIFLFQRKVITPFQQISASLKKIAEGDLAHRVQTSDTLPEIHTIACNINEMLQKIQDYKEEGFRLRMDAVQAKLQFLQLQIKPHFYLNCLKSVNALLNLHEYENARTLVLTLSNYITHTFGDTRSFIPLRSELEAVQSYVTLRNLTFSMNIQLHFQLDGRCAAAQCLPMSVLTFVENSIKHADGRKAIDVTIQAGVVTQGNRPKLAISITDTGKGFSEAFLDEQKHADPSQMVYRRNQVGISNIRYRLWLTYENEASLTLENREGHAGVTLCIPYEPMEEGIS